MYTKTEHHIVTCQVRTYTNRSRYTQCICGTVLNIYLRASDTALPRPSALWCRVQTRMRVCEHEHSTLCTRYEACVRSINMRGVCVCERWPPGTGSPAAAAATEQWQARAAAKAADSRVRARRGWLADEIWQQRVSFRHGLTYAAGRPRTTNRTTGGGYTCIYV